MFQNILSSRDNNLNYSDLTIKTSKIEVLPQRQKGNMQEEIISNLILELTSIEEAPEEKNIHLVKYLMNKNAIDLGNDLNF